METTNKDSVLATDGHGGRNGVLTFLNEDHIAVFASACFLLGATFTIALLCLRLARKWRVRRRYLRRQTGACYVCGEPGARRPGPSWSDHRRKCGARHAARLTSLYRHPWARCPLCAEPLALLPCSPHDFSCQNDAGCCAEAGKKEDAAAFDSAGVVTQMNCGDNRFNCFPCDFDVCKDCIEEAAELQKHHHQQQHRRS